MQCKDKRLRPPQWRIVARAEKQFGLLSPELKSQEGRIQRMPRATFSIEQTQVRQRFRQFLSETSNAMVPNPPSIIKNLSHINSPRSLSAWPSITRGMKIAFFRESRKAFFAPMREKNLRHRATPKASGRSHPMPTGKMGISARNTTIKKSAG